MKSRKQCKNKVKKFSKEIEITNKNQTEILELRDTMNEIKTTKESIGSILDQAKRQSAN